MLQLRFKKGRIALLMVLLIVIMLSSAAVLSLVRFGVLNPKAEQGSLLNAKFIPYSRQGYLAVNDFKFCSEVDARYTCKEKDMFHANDKVYFTFMVESSVFDNQVVLLENYRLKAPDGAILLQADDKHNFQFNAKSLKEVETIPFRDFFIIYETKEGTYTVELILTNPLLEKKVEVTQTFDYEP